MDTDTIYCCLNYLLKDLNVQNFNVVASDQISSVDFEKTPSAICINSDPRYVIGRFY